MGALPSSSFDGRAVLVTGGLGGIGTAIAHLLAARGAHVYLARRPGSKIPECALTHLHPIGRIGTPTDVASAVALLLDPLNDFMTGAMLAVDGGQLVL